MKKKLAFHVLDNFVFLYFSTARQAAFALHNNDDSEVTSEQLNQWNTNPGSTEKLFTYAVYLVLY